MKILTEPHVNDNLNWVTLLVVVLSLPLVAILTMSAGVQPTMPIGATLGIAATALVLMFWKLSGGFLLRDEYIRIGCMIWLAGSSVFILFIASDSIKIDKLIFQFLGDFFQLMIIVLLVRLVVRRSSWLANHIAFIGAACGLLLGQIATAGLLIITIRDLPYVYDPVLYRFDGMLGLSWTNVAGDILSDSSVLKKIVMIIYMTPTYWIILGAVSTKKFSSLSRDSLMMQFLLASFLGYSLYYLMPALGPAYFFGPLFPDHLPNTQTLADHFVIAPAATLRNAMPSLHATWALLVFLALKNSPNWHERLGMVLVIATMLGTLGFGEHYAVDWIAAFPLALLVRGLCAFSLPIWDFTRKFSIVIGAALIFLWIAAVRGAPVSLGDPFMIRILALCSIVLPFVFERKLARSEQYNGVEVVPSAVKSVYSA